MERRPAFLTLQRSTQHDDRTSRQREERRRGWRVSTKWRAGRAAEGDDVSREKLHPLDDTAERLRADARRIRRLNAARDILASLMVTPPDERLDVLAAVCDAYIREHGFQTMAPTPTPPTPTPQPDPYCPHCAPTSTPAVVGQTSGVHFCAKHRSPTPPSPEPLDVEAIRARFQAEVNCMNNFGHAHPTKLQQQAIAIVSLCDEVVRLRAELATKK